MSRGGRKDRKPQVWTFESSVQSAADVDVFDTFATPIPKFGSSTRPTVLEVLAIDSAFYGVFNPAVGVHFHAQLSTVFLSKTDSGDPRVLYASARHVKEDAGYSYQHNFPDDYTDQRGNGTLVATDNLYLKFETLATGYATNKVYIKILYRLIDVPLSEWVGIVQSQQ